MGQARSAAPIVAEPDQARPGPERDTPAAITARRLTEVRMRLAHRATGSEAALARSIVPGDALPAGAARAEVYRGEESAARRVIEVVSPIVAQVSSWAGLHAALAQHGITYEAKGSGAIIVVDGIPVKASTCRAASRTRLEQRLGPFRPGPETGETRPPTDRRRLPAAASSPRPAPGVDPDLFAFARRTEREANAARSAYDAAYPMLSFAPLLKAAVAGPAPPAAPSARTLAKRTGKTLPRLAPLQRPGGGGTNVTGLLGLYHAALQADRYRVVAERPRLHGGSDQDPGLDRDRLMQLTPRPMAEVALGWTALEQAAGSGRAVHLRPISDDRHHVVLSGLGIEQVARLQASGFAPALVLHKGDGLHEVVLTTPNAGRPYEQAAMAEASEDLRLTLGVARSPYGLRIDDPDHPEAARPGAEGSPRRIYAQILTDTGATCEKLGRLIGHWIGVFARRFGLGPGSRLGRGLKTDGTEPDGAQPNSDAPLYWAHRADLLARWQGRWPDPSRVDALIARRLRGTGHREDAVAALITACAPAVPRIGRHAWPGYGWRAAAHAFRDDAVETGRAFDRTSPAMWLELEQAVRKREQAVRPKPLSASDPLLVPVLPEMMPLTPPKRPGVRVGTTNKGQQGSRRGDDWWD